jgi:hypothetical protein
MEQLDRPYAKPLLIIAVVYLAFGLISIIIDLKGMFGLSAIEFMTNTFSANWPEVLYIMGLFVMLIFSFVIFGESEDLDKT